MFAAVACGDGPSDDGPTVTPPPPTARTAVQIIPDLTVLGFQPSTQQLPGFTPSDTSTVALFENPAGPVTSVRFEITIAQNVSNATQRYNAFATALKNPPPDLFGGSNAKQADGTVVFQADQSASYRSDKPDSKGTYVFSDIHRFGRATVVFYTIGPEGEATNAVRKAIAQQMAARAPR